VIVGTTQPWPEIAACLDSLHEQARDLGVEILELNLRSWVERVSKSVTERVETIKHPFKYAWIDTNWKPKPE